MNHNGNSPMPSPEITWIDLEKWPRRTHFESFTTYSRCMIHASAFFRELQARCDAPDALSRPEGASLS